VYQTVYNPQQYQVDYKYQLWHIHLRTQTVCAMKPMIRLQQSTILIN